MATEFRLNYTGSEINRKLQTVDETKSNLENNYYTSVDIDTKIGEVNTSIEKVSSSIETGLAAKADLVGGKIPASQLPDDIGGSDVDLSDYYTKTETDEALSVKADLVGGKVPLEQLPDDIGSGGGLTEVSWEDVNNKPFYDTRKMSYYSQVENPNPLTINNAMLNMSFYKVSDLIPTREQIFNEMKVIINAKQYTYSENGIQLETDDFICVYDNTGSFGFIFVNKTGTLNFTHMGYPMSFEVPEAGIYYQRDLNAGVPEGRTIEFIVGGELKQIDPKFIPADLDFNLDDYYTKSETYAKSEVYTKSQIDNLIGDVNTIIDEIDALIGA